MAETIELTDEQVRDGICPIEGCTNSGPHKRLRSHMSRGHGIYTNGAPKAKKPATRKSGGTGHVVDQMRSKAAELREKADKLEQTADEVENLLDE